MNSTRGQLIGKALAFGRCESGQTFLEPVCICLLLAGALLLALEMGPWWFGTLLMLPRVILWLLEWHTSRGIQRQTREESIHT